MSDRRSHDATLLNSTNFAGASAWCWNFSTQIGASAATTAASARWVAIFSAVLPSVHPSDENPTTANAAAPAAAPHTAGFIPGWIFISSPWLWEKRTTSPVSTEEIISSGKPTNVRLGNYSEDAGAARFSDMGDGASYQAARCGARQRAWSAHRVVTAGPDCAMLCRQEGLGSSTCRGFRVLGFGMGTTAARAPRPASNVMPDVRLINAQRAGPR
jgi:hypothetical protein